MGADYPTKINCKLGSKESRQRVKKKRVFSTINDSLIGCLED